MAYRSEIAQSMALDQIRYSRVWEDSDLLVEGLDIGPQDDVLSVTSSGDNVLALLLAEPKSVTAIDMSPVQNALLELKLAAIRNLSHGDMVAFIGERDCDDRLGIYQQLRQDLPLGAQEHLDAYTDAIAEGICSSGRLERYFRTFQTEYLDAICVPENVERLLKAKDLGEQRLAFRKIATGEMNALFRWYFGRTMMGRHGRDPAQLEHVTESDIGQLVLDRFRHCCTEVPAPGNHYLEAFLTSRYRDLSQGPAYLRPENFDRLRGLIDRVSVVTAEIEGFVASAPTGTISKANLSDIFEYMSSALCQQMFGLFADQLRSGGRIAYWNLFVPRSPGPPLTRLRSVPVLRQDRVFFYRSFRVEEVTS